MTIDYIRYLPQIWPVDSSSNILLGVHIAQISKAPRHIRKKCWRQLPVIKLDESVTILKTELLLLAYLNNEFRFYQVQKKTATL